jgi:hypothetical protein
MSARPEWLAIILHMSTTLPVATLKFFFQPRLLPDGVVMEKEINQSRKYSLA